MKAQGQFHCHKCSILKLTFTPSHLCNTHNLSMFKQQTLILYKEKDVGLCISYLSCSFCNFSLAISSLVIISFIFIYSSNFLWFCSFNCFLMEVSLIHWLKLIVIIQRPLNMISFIQLLFNECFTDPLVHLLLL